MKNRTIQIVTASGTLALFVGLSAPLAFAQSATAAVNVNASTAVTTSVKTPAVRANAGAAISASATAKAKDRANQEITRRINALSSLAGRIGDMKRISEDDMAALHGEITAQASSLAQLKTKIDADDGTSIKDDVQSITSSYRVFVLVVPKTATLAAVDRIGTIVTQMKSVSVKLQTLISTASSSGGDVAAAQATLADYNTKVADASIQASAAHDMVVGLQADNGDASVASSTRAALKNAREKIRTAQQDLVAARKDITTIRKELADWIKVRASATTTVSASATEEE